MKNLYINLTFAILSIALSSSAQEKGTYTDTRDGNVYGTVKIGNQTWFVQNLAYKAGSGCWAYKEDTNNVATYGYLYDWFTAKSSCPVGWHLPSDKEWKTLISNLGEEDVAGGKLKEKGLIHWISPNESGSNESGFTALPGGFLNGFNVYSGIGECGIWWCSDFHTSMRAWYYYIVYKDAKIKRRHLIMNGGLSVKCIKD
jgi:uncharacterized protein (TIGR02145 family)